MNWYPENWREISLAAKVRARFTCDRCGKVLDAWNPIGLHTHHIDFNKGNCDPSNLRVLCVDCHYEYHRLNDPLWDPQPEFDNPERNRLDKPVRVGGVMEEIFPRYVKIQRVNLLEGKP